MTRMGWILLTGGAALWLGGCGASVPYEEAATARSALSAAEASGAQEVPSASLYLKMSKDGIAKAEGLMETEPDHARELLERAKADAELARTMSAEADARMQADYAVQRIEQLQGSF